MVEVKCLKAQRHIEAVQYHKKHGRAPTDYVQQTQGQILLAEREWCDLIFHHPDLPQLIIRQMPDKAIHAALIKGIADVIQERDDILVSMKCEQTHIPEKI